MFGYIRPYSAELKVKEDRFYKALYCGICKALGKTIGRSARLLLSYDTVFLALLISELTGEPFTLKTGRCLLHPFRRRPLIEENDAIRTACAAGYLLAFYKLKDDKADEKGLRRFRAALALPFLRRGFSKAAACLHGELGEVERGFAAFAEAEAARESADALAAVTGRITGALFRLCAADSIASDCLGEIGEHLGRWIYLTDAADDFAEDGKRGRFNPFFPEGIRRDDLFAALEAELAAIEAILSRVRPRDPGVDAILQNILREGLTRVEKRVSAEPTAQKNDKKEKT